MAARQLAGRRPLYFTADVSILLLYFFFAAQSRGSLGRSSPNFAICSVVAVIFKCESEIWGGPSPQKIGGPKTSKFWILRFDREYLRTGTRYRRLENGVKNCNHSPYVHTKFGELWSTNDEK